jgi:hypothetical protein
MRMGAFLLGGLVGAVAVAYFSRSNRPMMLSSMMSGQGLGKMMNRARNRMAGTSAQSSAQSAAAQQDTASDGMKQVEKIIKKDPNLKGQVDQILAEGQAAARPQ